MITYCMNKIKTRRSPGTKISCFFQRSGKTCLLLFYFFFIYFCISFSLGVLNYELDILKQIKTIFLKQVLNNSP